MKNKLLVILLSICTVAFASIGLVGCGNGGGNIGGNGKPGVCEHAVTNMVAEGYEATCESSGRYEIRQCVDCEIFLCNGVEYWNYDHAFEMGYIEGGHDFEHVALVEPADCYTDGVMEHNKCRRCNAIYSMSGYPLEEEDVVIKASHVKNYVYERSASCLQDGYNSHYKCSVCEKLFATHVSTEEISFDDLIIPKLEHETSHTSAVIATCLNGGNLEYWYCYGCYKYYADEDCTIEIESEDIWQGTLQHSYTDVKVIKEAGCDYNEVKRYSCVNGCGDDHYLHCYDVETENTAKGHDFEDGACLNCFCDQFTEGLYCYTNGYGEETYAVVDGFGEWTPSGVLTIPEFYKGYPVKQVRLSNCDFDGVTKVVIPKSVTYISLSNNYYGDCKTLTEIEIASSELDYISIKDFEKLTSIKFTDEDCVIHELDDFSGLRSIETLVLKGDYEEISSSAFQYNNNLKNLVINKDVKIISYYAFDDCYELETIGELTKLEEIGNYAFEDCTSLTEIYIPSTVKSVGENAFKNCTSLEKVVIEDVKDYAKIKFGLANDRTENKPDCNPLYYAHWLYKNTQNGVEPYGDVVIDETIYDADYINANTKINLFAFAGCYNITKVVVPVGITEVGRSAFINNERLAEVQLHNKDSYTTLTLTKIGASAFEGCVNLNTVAVARSIKNFNADAFKGCENVTTVYFNSSANDTKWLEYNFANLYANPMWGGNAEIYIRALVGISYQYAIPNYIDLTPAENAQGQKVPYSISNYALAGMNSTIKGFEYVSNIGDGAFYNAGGVPAYVNLTGYTKNEIYNRPSTYKGCSNIGKEAFYGCKNLYSVYIPTSSSVTIGDKAFAYSNLAVLNVTNSSVTYGEKIFEGCENLNLFGTTYFSKTSSTSGTNRGLKYFFGETEPKSLTTIYAYGTLKSGDLEGAVNLKNLYIYSSTAINSGAFGTDNVVSGFNVYYQGTLKNYIQASNVLKSENIFVNVKFYTNEVDDEFAGTTKTTLLKDLVIPDGVTSIGSYKFSGITSIETVTIPYGSSFNVNSIGTKAFAGCTNLLEVFHAVDSTSPLEAGKTTYGYISYYAEHVYTVLVADRRVIRTEDGYVFSLSKGVPSKATLVRYYGEGGDIVLPSVFIDYDENNDGRIDKFDLIDPNNPNSGYANGGVKYQNYDIGSNVFANNQTITSITFPVNELGKSTVEVIGDNAFSKCYNLKKVVLQEGLKEIRARAFDYTAITSIIVPDSVTVLGKYNNSYGYYEESPFRYCQDLYQLVIGKNSPYVKYLAYDYVVEIVDRSGNYLNKTDTGADIVHDGTSKIFYEGDFAFIRQNGQLTLVAYVGSDCEIVLPDMGEPYVIREHFLEEDTNIIKVTISNDVVRIDDRAFYMSAIKEVVMGDGVKEIGNRAFYYCQDLVRVQFGKNVETIEQYAFYNTGEIEEIALPATIKSIETYAFVSCYVKKLVIEEGFAPEYIASIVFSLNNLEEIHVKKLKDLFGIETSTSLFVYNSDNARLYIDGELATELVITEQDCAYIPDYLFDKIQGIDKVTISGVKEIGRYAFYRSSVKEVIINNVDVIGDSAFENAKMLSKLTLNGVIEIHVNAFAYTSIYSVVLPDTVKVIKDGAFSTVTDVVLVDGIEELGNAFADGKKTVYNNGVYLGTATNPYFALVDVENNPVTITLHNDTKILAGNALNNMGDRANEVVLNEGLISIGSYALGTRGFSYLTSVKLPSTLKYISEKAFYYTNLTSIEIPANVERIGKNAFYGCDLTSVTFKGESKLEVIEEGVFEGCYQLTEIIIPNSVKTIKKNAFEQINSLTLGSGLQYVEEYAFDNVSNVYLNDIKDWLQVKCDNCFYSDAKFYLGGNLLTEVIVPEGVTTIHKNAFYDNDDIIKFVGSSTLETIGNNAFAYCNSLETIELGGATTVGDYAFSGTKGTEINAPNVVNIGASAFACSATNKLTLGKDLENIGTSAFGSYSTANLVNGANVYFLGSVNDWASISFGNMTSNPLSSTVNSNGAVINMYFNGEQPTELVISAETVGDYAFIQIPYITSVTFTDTVKNVGKYAFYQCVNLKTVNFGKNVENIGDYAFYCCGKLDTVTGLENVKYVGDYAFYRTKITSADLSSVISVGEYAFYEVPLSSIVIGKDFTNAKANAFNLATTGSTVDFKFGYEELATKTFDGLYSNPACFMSTVKFNGVVIPESVTFTMAEIKPYTYAHVPFVNITLGEGVQIVGDYAFSKNTALISVDMSDTVVTLGTGAFYNAENLKTLKLSNSLKTIESYMLQKHSLSEIIIPDSVEVVENYAFNESDGTNDLLKKVHIGKNLSSIEGLFETSHNIKEITIDSENSYFVLEDGVLYTADKTSLIYCIDKTKTIFAVPTGVKTIRKGAFYGNTAIAVVTLPSTLETIESSAFYGCNKLVEVINLSSISISTNSSNGYVGYYAKKIVSSALNATYSVDENGFVTAIIDNAYTLIGYQGDETNLVIPTNVQRIYKYALSGLVLESIEITNANVTFDSSCFAKLTVESASVPAGAVKELPSSVKDLTINGGTLSSSISYQYMTSVKVLTICENVTFKQDLTSAFSNHSQLETVNIYCSVIVPNAFANCGNIKTLNIGSNVKQFGSGAFYNCKNIVEVYYDGTIDDWASIEFNHGYAYNSEGSNPMYFGAGLYINDKLVEGEITINVATVSASAFSSYTKVTSVILSDNVVEVGANAFTNMPHLTHVTVGSNVATINTNAFDSNKIVDIYNRSRLNIVAHFNGNDKNFGRLGFYALNVYTSLNGKKISYNDGFAVVNYGERKVLVDYYGEDTDIVIPSSVTEINAYAFKGYKTTNKLTIPTSVTVIKRYAIYGASFGEIIFDNAKNWYKRDSNYNEPTFLNAIDGDMTGDILISGYNYYNFYRLEEIDGDNDGDSDYLVRVQGSEVILLYYNGDILPKTNPSELQEYTVYIPEGVTEIGYQALKNIGGGLSNVSVKLVMPNTLKRVDKQAFYWNNRCCITSIDLQNNNSGWYKTTTNDYTNGTYIGSGVTSDAVSTATLMATTKDNSYSYAFYRN